MELADYISLVRKRWGWLVALAAIGLAIGLLYSLASTPMYRASAQVFVSLRGGDSTSELVQGTTFTAKQVRSYTELVKSPRALEPVIEQLGLDATATSLAGRVEASVPQDTVLINIEATDASPTVAADIANATAANLAVLVAEIENAPSASESTVELSVVRSATPPTTAASPNTRMNAGLGLVLGLALGVAAILLREILDTRVRTPEDVRAVTDASVIGMISYDEGATQHPLIVQESPHSPRAEALRRVRTNLQFLTVDGDGRTLVMTSAIPGEGKSTTSINLAITMADAGSRVIIVDADLRRPSVSKYMGLEGAVGLTTVLIGRASLEDAVQPWGNQNLHVLPSGQIPPNPSELLGSRQMADLLKVLRDSYDIVILDTAPLLPVTDGAVLAKLAGGAVIVVGAGLTHRPQLAEAMSALAAVDARVHGIVLNRMSLEEGAGYRYRYYEYSSEEAHTGAPPSRLRRGLTRMGLGKPRHVRRPPDWHPSTASVEAVPEPEPRRGPVGGAQAQAGGGAAHPFSPVTDGTTSGVIPDEETTVQGVAARTSGDRVRSV